MASEREVKNRLRGVHKTRQITSAMKMVATIKLRHAQAALANARPYAEKMRALAAEIFSQVEDRPDDVPFLARRNQAKLLFVVIASDRGLCGSLNANVFREVLQAVDEASRGGANASKPQIELLLVGRKAKDFFRARQNNHSEGLPYRVREARGFAGLNGVRLGKECCELFCKGEFDRVDFFYNESVSSLQHRPARLKLLPFDVSLIRKEGVKARANVIFEPSGAAMLEDVIGEYIASWIWKIVLEADVTEQAARMLMMDLATKNADELIMDMRLAMNKLRQLSITLELADITTGAEAVG